MIGLPLLLFGVFFALERRARRREAAGDAAIASGAEIIPNDAGSTQNDGAGDGRTA